MKSTACAFAVTMISVGVVAALGFAEEKPQTLRDRYGDPLPTGTLRRFGTLRFRHPGVRDLAFSADGKQLFASGSDSLDVFDAASGRKVRSIGHDQQRSRYLLGFALSPDGKQLAGCASHVFVWELGTGQLLRQFFEKDRYWEVAFSPNGKHVAAIQEVWGRGAENQIRIVIRDIASSKGVADWLLKGGKPQSISFLGLAYSPDGKYLAVCFCELHEEKPFVHSPRWSQVWLLDAVTGQRVRTFGGADAPVICFAFQPESGSLTTYGKDRILRFWNAESGKEVQHYKITNEREESTFGQLRFSADGKRCALPVNRGKSIVVLDTQDGRLLRRIQSEESLYKTPIALSPDGTTLAASRLPDQTCVRVCDVASGVERFADAGHRAAVNALSLSSDGRTLISRDELGGEIHWDLHTGQGVSRPAVARGESGDLTWSPDFSHKSLRAARWRVVYKNQRPGLLEVWSLDGAKRIRSFETDSHYVPTVTVSPDGTRLAITVQKLNDRHATVMLWEPEREEKPRVFPGAPDYCRGLVFSHSGEHLIASSGFRQGNQSHIGALWIWDTVGMKLVRNPVVDGMQGGLLVTGDDRVLLGGLAWKEAMICAWDMETGKELARMKDPSSKPVSDDGNVQAQPAITGLALSDDERFLAVVTSWEDVSAVSVWDVGSWKLIRSFAPNSPRNDVKAMVFSRDHRSLFVANSDSTILEWDVSGQSRPNKEKPSRERLDVLWTKLAESPESAYPAVWEMLDHPDQSLPFLKDKLQPIAAREEKRVRQLLSRLDSHLFAEREEASRQLLTIGDQFLPILQQTRKDRPSAETKWRLDRALEALSRGPSPEKLRQHRALAVLEWCQSAEADAHLHRLAQGASSASLTQAAKAVERGRKR